MNTKLISSVFLVFAIVCPTSAFADDTADLLAAAARGDINRVQALLSSRTDVSATNTDGVTALWMAAQDGHVGIVKVLLEAGADVNAAKPNGVTALWIAAQNGHTRVVETLLRSKADANIQRKTDGMTALMMAAIEGRRESGISKTG